MTNYSEASAMAYELMRSGADQEQLRLAVNEAERLAPTKQLKRYWGHMANAMSDGRTLIRSKEQ